MEKNIAITPIQHKDVRGNDQWYLKMATEKGEFLLNIGQKTFETVSQLIRPAEAKPQPKK